MLIRALTPLGIELGIVSEERAERFAIGGAKLIGILKRFTLCR